MVTKLFDRIMTLVKADAHGLLESLEERSLLLKQYVREAEMALDRKRARVETLRGEEKRLRHELEHLRGEITGLDGDIQLAIERGKEDVARFAIRRLIPRRNQARILEAQLNARIEERQLLEKRVEIQREQFEALRARARAELSREPESAAPAGAVVREPISHVPEEEVELELMRRRPATAGGGS
jgi:phage shock protein A